MFEAIDLHLLPLLSGKDQTDRSLPYCHHFHSPRLEHPMGAGGFSGFLKMAGSPKMDKLCNTPGFGGLGFHANLSSPEPCSTWGIVLNNGFTLNKYMVMLTNNLQCQEKLNTRARGIELRLWLAPSWPTL